MYTKFLEAEYQPFHDSSSGGWQYYYHTSLCTLVYTHNLKA